MSEPKNDVAASLSRDGASRSEARADRDDQKPIAAAASRRSFLKSAAAGLAIFHIVPSHVLGGAGGRAPSEKLRIACIGVGGRGRASVDRCAQEGHEIVALCDVDDREAGATYKAYPKAKRFRDFRVMLDEISDEIDAVTVGTPDHTHAVAVMAALRRGKHVYCEKPLAHSIHEIRAIMRLAAEKDVTTQLGNQGHSFDSIRTCREWIESGVIGEVTEVHAGCDAFPHVYCQLDKLPKVEEQHEIPKELDYDLWLGPTPKIAYSPLWVPWNWRGWMPFGTGAVGDWGCHVLDPAFWALALGSPTSVRAEVDSKYHPEKHRLVYPPGTKITYEFPANGSRGPVKLIWFDGNKRIPKGEGIDGEAPGTGAIVYGKKGAIVHGSHGAANVRIGSEALAKDFKKPEPSIPRVRKNDHHNDWLDSIAAGKKAGSDIATYGGPLTEVALLGAIAIRFPGETLEWDAKAMKVTNIAEANKLVAPEYRDGWTL